MKIQERKLETIKPYPNNPRRNDEAVQAVAASIREFGFKQPIVVDKDGVIIVGHTRYKAAKELGMDTVPVLVADDLTEDQARAYRLADNKTGELAGWDFGLLQSEMDEIEMDLSGFGFELDQRDVTVSLDDLEGDPKEPEPKRIRCPLCGEWFEP